MKTIVTTLVLLLTLIIFSLCIHAQEIDDPISEFSFSEIEGLIPKEVADMLPKEIFSQSGTDAAKAVGDAFDVKTVFSHIVNSLLASVPSTVSQFAILFGILILSSAFGVLSESLKSAYVSQAVKFVIVLTLVSGLFLWQKQTFEASIEYLKSLTSLINGLLPVMGTVYALGGNISSAVVQSGFTMLMLAVCENAVICVFMPILKMCFGFSLVTAISGGKPDMSGVSKTVKGLYTAGISFLMIIILVMLTARNMIASAGDGFAAQTVKFGNFIPIIGGALGDSLGAVTSGLTLIKNGTGAIGVLLILFMTLPTIISLMVNNVALSLLSLVSGVLGCDFEKKLFDEAKELSGFAMALCGICALTFILSISVFVGTNVAIKSAGV